MMLRLAVIDAVDAHYSTASRHPPAIAPKMMPQKIKRRKKKSVLVMVSDPGCRHLEM
jgi:hypothetical protein